MFARYVIAAGLFVTSLPTLAAEPVTTPEDRTSLSLTVYQQNLALVHDVRRIKFSAGRERLAIVGVPSALIPETVLAEGATPNRLRVLGQVYEAALLTPEALLEAAVGGMVHVVTVHPETGAETFTEAEVLRAQGREALVRLDDRIRTLDVRRLAFVSAPTALRVRPTLVLDLASTTEGEETLSLSYLTSGLNWRADYVAQLSKDETEIRLAGWVTLTNTTATAFKDARLRVVAGSINRTARRPIAQPRLKARMTALEASADAPAESAVSDLRVFDFEEAISIGRKEVRQLALLPGTQVQVKKEYRLEGNASHFGNIRRDVGHDYPAARFHLENTKAAGLGRSLPGGTLRLYAPATGGKVLRGEDTIRHTPKGETVTITAGRATDITSERRQTEFRREGLPRNVTESAHAIMLRNAKDEAVIVTVVEHIPGNWRMLSESQAHTKRKADEAVWRVSVPAGGETELTYRVRTRF
ncbi:MAG: DUF4139 domain-containing protein [Alphaproteobacteria bacterium]|nr:DUF4139 domain-containing protein [Alphaproteobacteria bacterium]